MLTFQIKYHAYVQWDCVYRANTNIRELNRQKKQTNTEEEEKKLTEKPIIMQSDTKLLFFARAIQSQHTADWQMSAHISMQTHSID